MTFDEIKAIALDDKISTRSLSIRSQWSIELNTLMETMSPLNHKTNPNQLVGCAIYQTSTDSFLSDLPDSFLPDAPLTIQFSVENPIIYFYLHKTIEAPNIVHYAVSCYKSIIKIDSSFVLVSAIVDHDETPELIDFIRRQFNDI